MSDMSTLSSSDAWQEPHQAASPRATHSKGGSASFDRTRSPSRSPALPKHHRRTRSGSNAGSSVYLDDVRGQPADSYFDSRLQRSTSNVYVEARSQPNELGSMVASPLTDVPPEYANHPTTEIQAGLIQKAFFIPTELLTRSSPYFERLAQPIPTALEGPFFFLDLDEYACSMFVRWLYAGGLKGPHDFHSMQHYLCLYVLAARFQIEALKNMVMDLIRAYYRRESMTAPAFRIEYVYANTDGPCPMRDFLVMTAAYRALSDGESSGISDSVKGVLKGGGDFASDFADALVKTVRYDRMDVRKGDNCKWHEHEVTEKCPQAPGLEPYETA